LRSNRAAEPVNSHAMDCRSASGDCASAIAVKHISNVRLIDELQFPVEVLTNRCVGHGLDES
jgi:hypothetical protein